MESVKFGKKQHRKVSAGFNMDFSRFSVSESLVLSGWVSLTARSAASRSAELSGLACEEVPSFLDMKLQEIQKKIKKNTLGQWVPHLLDPSTRAYALNTGDVTIGFLWILLTLAKWRRTKVGDKIIPGLTNPLESKPLKKLQIGSFLCSLPSIFCIFGQNPMSWIIQKVCLNGTWPQPSSGIIATPCMFFWKLPGTHATRALESRGPCNDAPAKQLPWSIPKFSAKSRRDKLIWIQLQ